MSAPAYVIVDDEDAFERKLPGAEKPSEWHSRWGLWRCNAEGQPVETVGHDGGEPEDQLLVRDWSWVAEELNRVAAERDAALESLRWALPQTGGARVFHVNPADCQSRGPRHTGCEAYRRARTLVTP